MITTETRGVGINRNLALTYAKGEICLFADDDVTYNDDVEERVLAEIMTEAHRYDSIHVDFTVENEDEDSWASVTEILKRVKDVVDCSHQSSTKLESFQQA